MKENKAFADEICDGFGGVRKKRARKGMRRGTIFVALVLAGQAALSASYASRAAGEEISREGTLEQSSASSEREKVPLRLAEAVKIALANNLDIQIEERNPEIRRQEVGIAQSIFEPLYRLSGSGGQDREPTASALSGATLLKRDNLFYKMELEKKFPYGTLMNLAYNATRLQTNSAFIFLNPNWTTDLTLSMAQPLLRNFGRLPNEAEVYVARNNHQVSLEKLRHQMIRTTGRTERTYWDLVFAIKDLEAKEKSLHLARDLLRNNELRVEAGTLAPIEITRAKASVATRQEATIIARNAIRDAEDLLRREMNEPGRPLYEDVEVVPVDFPSAEVVEVDYLQSISTAIQRRPEYLESRKELENSGIRVVVAKNRLLPLVDLEASYTRNGLGGTWGGNWESTTDGTEYNYSAGLVVEVPLGNRRAKSDYARARLQKEQVLLSQKNLELQIVVEVKAAVRAVQRDIERIRSNALAVDLARERLDAEEKKFDAGVSISLDVLDAQQALAQTESNYQRALTDYNKSLVNLEEAMGTLLEKKRIIISD